MKSITKKDKVTPKTNDRAIVRKPEFKNNPKALHEKPVSTWDPAALYF
jgi:hypothetical protein